MKRILYSMALATSVMFGFSSCDEEEEEIEKVDVKEQAVGIYNVKMNYYISDGEQWETSGIDSETNSGNVAIVGDNLKFTDDDDEIFSFVKITEANNGFSFDVEDYSFVDNGVTYTFKGLNGIELESKKDGSSTKFNGGYFSDTKTLKFYFELPKDQAAQLLEIALANNETLMTSLLEIAKVDLDSALEIAEIIDELLSKLYFIVEYNCTQVQMVEF